MDKKSTIMDVAKRSGYSITTVSRVMNGNYPVKEETRQKIEEAIKELGFSPNVLARGLIGAKTYSLGIIVPSIENLFFSEVIRGIQNVLQRMDYTALICSTNGDKELEKKHRHNLLARKVDGIILVSPDTRIHGKEYGALSKTVPLVLVNGETEGYDCHFVSSDQATGTRKALEYFLEEGHQKIGFLRGQDHYSYNLKETLYRHLMQEKGLEVDEEMIIRIGDGNTLDTLSDSAREMKKVLENRKDITAVFACNDLMGVGALNAARELGISVPDQLRIIGFDNTIICEVTQPKLSTVDQHMRQLGEAAAKKILALIDKEDLTDQKKTMIGTQLIIRNT